MNRKLQELPIGNKRRQGALHAGIRYQYLKTILAWISLKDTDDYVVTEWIDDVFVAANGSGVISDAKYINSASSLTLRSRPFLECLGNAFTHLVENSAGPEIRYSIVTNLSAGNENPSLPNLGKCGMSAWEAARKGDTALQAAIVHFLLEEPNTYSKIKNYLRNNSLTKVWDHFLGRFFVDVDAGDLLETFRSIEAILKSRCERYDLPRVGIPSFIQHLESMVADAASQSNTKADRPRKLMLVDFQDAWDERFTRMHVPYAQWCKESYGTSRLSVLEEADAWLEERFGSGYSRRELIEKGLAFYCSEELAKQQLAIDCLVGGSCGGDVAVSGNVGSGKTLLAASLAIRLSAMAYQIYYAKINAETNPFALLTDIKLAQERSTIPIVVVLDDCQRNDAVLVHLQLRRSQISVPALLFVANSQDRFLQERAELEFAAVLDKFSDGESHISTNLCESAFKEKVAGIIEAWALVHSDRELVLPSSQELGKIAADARGNLGSLKAALTNWCRNSSLRQLVKQNARGDIYRKFLAEENIDHEERNLLLQTAAVASYGVDFGIPDHLRRTAISLRKRGLLEKTNREIFRFLEDARPGQLIDAYLGNLHNSEELFANLLCGYFELHESLPLDTGQLLLEVGSERSKRIIEQLFNRRDTRQRIEAFLESRPSNRLAIEFLFRIRDSIERQTLRQLVADQLVDSAGRFNELSQESDALLLWTKCLRLSTYCDRETASRLHQNVAEGTVNAYIRNAGFHQLAYCAWTLCDVDRTQAKCLLKNSSFEALLESATDLPPRDFVRGVRRLRNVDVEWTQQFCRVAATNRNGPFFGLFRLSVEEFASAIGELNWCDELALKKFLGEVTTNELTHFRTRSSSAALAMALSTLKDVDRGFAQRFLDATTHRGTDSPFSRQAIRNLGNSLSELYRVADGKARTELRRYSDDELLSWARAAPLFKLGKTFAELSKISPTRIKGLFEQIGFRCLAEKAANCENVGYLTKALSELAAISKDRACFILNSVDDASLIHLFESCSVDSLGRSLREIQNVDKKQAEWVADKLSVDAIASSYKTISLRNLGLYLSEVRTVSPELSKAILERLDNNSLKKMVKCEANIGELFAAIAKISEIEGVSKHELGDLTSVLMQEAEKRFPILANNTCCRFEELSNGLRAINRIDSVAAKRLYGSIPFSKLEAKLRAEQVEKGLVALGSLSRIDHDITLQLFDRVTDDHFISKVIALAPDRLSHALNSAAQVSKDLAFTITESIELDAFRKAFAAMDAGRQRQVSNKLSALSSREAKRLLGSYASSQAKHKKRRQHHRRSEDH